MESGLYVSKTRVSNACPDDRIGCPKSSNGFQEGLIKGRISLRFSPQSGDIFIERTKSKRPMPAASHEHLRCACLYDTAGVGYSRYRITINI